MHNSKVSVDKQICKMAQMHKILPHGRARVKNAVPLCISPMHGQIDKIGMKKKNKGIKKPLGIFCEKNMSGFCFNKRW